MKQQTETLLIQGGLVLLPSGEEQRQDILIEAGRIVAMGENLPHGTHNVLDATGLHILPGLVDAHVHLRDPGQEYKEDIATGTRAAAMGGVTSVACMPNTKPSIDSPEVIRYILDKNEREGVVHVHPVAAITCGQNGQELTDMAALKAAGAVAVSDDGKPVHNPAMMRRALEAAGAAGITVISHCEDLDLAAGGCMNEGVTSRKMGVKGIPTVSEDLMVVREILLSEYTGVPVHIAHVSSAVAVSLIRDAKRRGVKVTAETCPHYFTLTETACEGGNANAKMNPPLRTETDRQAIIEGLRDGTLDIITTDHAPHHPDEKNNGFEKAMNGILGLETSFGLSYTHLVETGVLTLAQLVDCMSRRPANILHLDKGSIAVGAEADLIAVDLDTPWQVDVNRLASKSRNTPFDGWTLKGAVRHTIVAGAVVVQDGNLVV